MKISTLLCLILVLSTSVSCAKKSKSSGKKYTTLTQEQIQAVMDNQILTCGAIDDMPCPEGVVRILTLDKERAENSTVCSGFMVEKNIMVTNHHCISTATQCDNSYLAIYDGRDYMRSKCKKVIKAVEDYANEQDSRRSMDFAVIEIEDDFYGETFSLASTQAAAGETVTAWVVDHTGLDRSKEEANPLEARITELTCTVAAQASSASLELENCPVIYGNSGSPLVNSEGEIVGVIWGASKPDTNANTPLSERRELKSEALATEMIHFAEFTKI